MKLIKKSITLIIPLLFITIISCSKNDAILTPKTLEGDWYVVKVTCDICNDVEADIGDETWTFDLSENKLYVESTTTVSAFLADGSYYMNPNYPLDSLNLIPGSNVENVIKIEDTIFEFFYYYFEDNKLIMTHFDSETSTIEFVRP